jgi:hypothetical protein
MLLAWLILLIKLGISPKLLINFLLDVNPFMKAVALARFIPGLGDILGNLTIS